MTTTCEEAESENVSKTEYKTNENLNNDARKKDSKKMRKGKKRKADNNDAENKDDFSNSKKISITTITNGLPNGDGFNSIENSQDNNVDHEMENSNQGESESVKKNEKLEKEEEEMRDLGKITDKEASRITGKSLRASFNNSTEGLTELKKFVAICYDKKKLDLATQYLNAGGSALEILKLLDTTDKKSLGNATTVFAAMEIVIMKILEKYPQYNASASEACRYLVNSHLSSIHSMLSSQSNAKQRKVVLRLLTAVVSLGGNLPRELLGHLSLHSQVLETLSRHTDPSDGQSVRTSFVHFILSFLVEGNLSVVRALLDKRGVISCIFPGLMYDSHTLVNLVLTTIKSYILENQGISKTIKLHTFSTPVVQNLVSLYNWKGPKNWPNKNRKKQGEEYSGYTDPEDKKVVVDVLHEFLLTLLTSNKFGIIFHDRLLGTSGQKNNQLADTILQSLDRPWEHEKPSDLVVKILVACPDLIRPQILYTEPCLEPSASRKWILLMEFIHQIIESLDPEVCFAPCSSELTTAQSFSALTNLTVNPIILKKGITLSINNENTAVRHTSVVLLQAMLKQLKNFIITLKKNCQDRFEIIKIENMVSDYLLKNLPSLNCVLIAWKSTLMPDKEIEGDESMAKTSETVSLPSPKESLTKILDLLLIYRDVCPQILETSLISSNSESIDSTTLLTGLNNLNDIEDEELGKMKVKALQFLLALDSSAFEAKKELFGEAVPFLISLLDSRQEFGAVNSQARNAIRTLFQNCGAFEGCNYQADIWISSIMDFDKVEDRIELANWLVEISRETVKYGNKYLEIIIKAEENGGEELLHSSTTIEDIFTDLMERDVKEGRNKTARLLPSVSISPLLVAGLENVKKNARTLLLDYLSRVTAHTLHCQVVPNAMINLVEDFEELPSKFYVQSWTSNGEHVHTKKIFGSKNVISKLSKALLTSSEIDVTKIFRGERKVSFKVEEEIYNIEHSMNPDEILSALKLSMFYFTRLIKEEDEKKFDVQLFCNIKIILASLFHVIKDIEKDFEDLTLFEKSCKFILSHPIILQYFSPLYNNKKKKKNILEYYSTELTAFVSLIVVDLFGENKISDLLIPFKDKFITKLLSTVTKLRDSSSFKDSPGVIRFVELLELNMNDIIEILTNLVQLPVEKFVSDNSESRLSMWGILIAKLLSSTIMKRENLGDRREFLTLDKSLVEKISQFMILPILYKSKDFHLWIDSLLAHLKKFPHNIAAIDKNFFLSLIKGKSSSSKIELASYLVNRNSKFISTYVKYSLRNTESLKNREFVFPILTSMGDNNIQKEFLIKLHDLYKEDILRWYSDPESVDSCIKKNVKAAVRLIGSVIDSETCDKLCERILSNGDKLFTADESYVDLLKIVFTKAAAAAEGGTKKRDNRLVDFSQILVHIIVSSLKKDSKNHQKHANLCETLLDVLNSIEDKENDEEDEAHFSEIRKNHSWPQFTRFSLKLGLKISKENKSQQDKLLKTLVKLCKVVYEDKGDDEYVKTLFEMTTSHSEFINVMLGTSETKRYLVELLLTLVRKNNSLMVSIHIPLYLGAYNATLSETDQIILQLLQYYESHNVRLTDYRPYLWGSAAASHYSVKSGADTALWRQPSTSQVLDLFSQENVFNTVRNYPVRRKLKSAELHPPQPTYDPAFYLPLLSYLLSDNSVVACHKITQSGALALALSACGSTEKETRLAALTVISRFYYHLEATNSKEKLLWLHFIDVFRNGISSSKPDVEDVRISCLVSTFMARTSLVATQPLNALYSPLQKFLMAKPVLDLNAIPEFLQLFHSSEIDHKLHRYWILEVIRDGLKTVVDTDVAFKCMIFKMLFTFYSCVLADRQSKNLILQVINSVTKIPNACILLVTGYGLLPWLNEIIYISQLEDIEFTRVFIDVLKNVYESLSQSNEKSEDLYFMLLRIMINLKSNLGGKNTDVESYRFYICILEKLISIKSNEFCKNLSSKDINELIEISKNILGDISECEDIVKFNSSKFIQNYLNPNTNDNDHHTMARYSLKRLLITWYSSKGI